MAEEQIRDWDHRGHEISDENHHQELQIEPIFSAFLCPLTKQVMRDPVTIENGHTFERAAVEGWFKECREKGRKVACPLTLVELQNDELKPSLALRNVIEEWIQRKEAAQLNLAYKSLTPGSSESDALHALDFILQICKKSRSNKLIVRNRKLIPAIANLLKNNNTSMRCKALEILCIVAEKSDDNKEAMASSDTILTIIKLLSHDNYEERESAVSLLYELSKSKSLSKRIGGVYGSILLLVVLASSKFKDVSIVEKAEKTLQNLEKCEENIKQMAENGRIQPLLILLLEGPPATQLLMASYLEELVLTNDVKVLMAQTAGSSLISIMSSGNTQAREIALKTLNKISSYDVSAKILVQSGILPLLVEGLRDVGVNQLPVKLKEISASILTNMTVCGADIGTIQLDEHGLTLTSEVVLHDLIHLINTAGSVIEGKLLQVLVGLTRSSKIVQKIASFIKSSAATARLTQFIEAPESDTRLASIKVLQNISPYVGQELAETFLVSAGHLSALIRVIAGKNEILEEQAAAIGLLANLPETNSLLTKQLWSEGTFEIVISKLIKIQHGETCSNRYLTPFLEGLVRVLSKLTYHLRETEYVNFACQHNLVALFAGLLQFNGLDKITIISAMALENLSRESIAVTKTPEVPKLGCWSSISMCLSKPPAAAGTCRVHRGICSARDSFCLAEAGLVEKLIACLDHENVNVVEAALAAICTLLDDNVDIQQGVIVLFEANGIEMIVDIMLENRSVILQKRAVWAVERILRTEEMASQVSDDPSIVTVLIEAFCRGDNATRQIAEQALKHVDKLPRFPA